MQIGARFVCTRCLLRGPSRACPRCARERLDLSVASSLGELRRAWPLCRAWERGVSFVSPRSILSNRRLLLVTVTATLGVAVGAPVMAALGRPGVSALQLLVAAAVSLTVSPFIAAFFGVFFFYYAHALRLLLLLLVLLASVLPLGRDRLRVTAFLVRLVVGGLLPRIELDARPTIVATTEGTLGESFALHDVRDGFGWMDRADAWATPLEVDTSHGRLRIDLRAGSLVLASSYQEPGAAGDGAYREAPRAPEIEAPAWADGHGRGARPRHRMIPHGRPIRAMGGTLVDGALVGTDESPVHIEIG